MSGKSRILRSLFLLAVFAGTILLSYSYILTHAQHDCIGDGCQVCSVLNLAREESEASGKAAVSSSQSSEIPVFAEYSPDLFGFHDSGIGRQSVSLIDLGIRSNC